jgi:hypothetical protein
MSRPHGCFRAAGWLVLTTTALLLGGCSNPEFGGPVSGKIVLEGKPVTNGAITFHRADGQTAISEVRDGNYRIERPPFGSCKVTILTVPPPPPGTGINPDPKWLRPAGYHEVPPRYGDPKTTPLSVEVTRDAQTKDFPLDP